MSGSEPALCVIGKAPSYGSPFILRPGGFLVTPIVSPVQIGSSGACMQRAPHQFDGQFQLGPKSWVAHAAAFLPPGYSLTVTESTSP